MTCGLFTELPGQTIVKQKVAYRTCLKKSSDSGCVQGVHDRSSDVMIWDSAALLACCIAASQGTLMASEHQVCMQHNAALLATVEDVASLHINIKTDEVVCQDNDVEHLGDNSIRMLAV